MVRWKESGWRLGKGNPWDESWLTGSVDGETGRQAENPETGRVGLTLRQAGKELTRLVQK